jgi:hexosaminidase
MCRSTCFFLFVVSSLLTVNTAANTAAHAQAPVTRAGRWEFSFAGPRGLQLSFDGVPILRQSSLNVVKPGWTGSLYSQAATTHKVQARKDGDTTVVTIDGANDLFSAHYDVTLRPDHTATLALTYRLQQEVPAELEYCAGYFNANLITRRRFTADTATGLREGVIPFVPASTDQQKNDLAPNWRRLTFDSRLGEFTVRVQSDEPRVLFFDARRDPQPWAQDAPIFWLGLGSPARPLPPLREQRVVLDLALVPNRSGEGSTRRHGDTEESKNGGSLAEGAAASVNFRLASDATAPSTGHQVIRSSRHQVQDAVDPRGRAPLVIPRPKETQHQAKSCPLSSRHRIVVFGPPEAKQAAEALQRELGERWKLTLPVEPRERAGSATTLLLQSRSAPSRRPAAKSAVWRDSPEGYSLETRRDQVCVEAGTPAGAFYGVQTLLQLLRHSSRGRVEVAGARIADWPSFPFRGVHMFPSGADPGFASKLVDRVIARHKLNRVVLEVENARWKSHPELHNALGATPEQLAALADQSRARFVEVIPLVQSLGHAQWMFEGGHYRHLAEDPDEPYAYCPSNPKSYELLFDIYEEAIRLFRPRTFHIGHDEVTNKGRFPHDEVCREKGLNRIFAEDVARLTEFLKERGIRPMLWGDMLLHASEASDAGNAATVEAARELRSLMPKEAVIADWHYAGVTVFPSLPLIRQSGLDVVAAGWWNPLNVAYLARSAGGAGALGLLQTTWVGRYPTEKVLANEARQFVAMLLAAEYAWSGRSDLPDEWEYTPGEEFARAWTAAPPEDTVRPGTLVPLDAAAWLTTTDAVGRVGWLGLGPEHDLSALTGGRVRLHDWQFELPPGRAAALPSRLGDAVAPSSVEVTVDRPAAEVGLLNATGWRVPNGTRVARMTVTYEDGATRDLELTTGRNTAAWTDVRAVAEAPVAWRGRTRSGAPVALRLTRWQNPRPEVYIRSLRFEPVDPEAAWTLFGLTLLDPVQERKRGADRLPRRLLAGRAAIFNGADLAQGFFQGTIDRQQLVEPGPSISRHDGRLVGDQRNAFRTQHSHLAPAGRDRPHPGHVQELQLLGVQQHPLGPRLLQTRQQPGQLCLEVRSGRIVQLAPQLQDDGRRRLIQLNR